MLRERLSDRLGKDEKGRQGMAISWGVGTGKKRDDHNHDNGMMR